MAISAWLDNDVNQQHKSRETRVRVMLEGGAKSTSGDNIAIKVHNISANGMLLESSEPMDVGTEFSVDLPYGVDTQASVLWVSGNLHGCKFSKPLGKATLSAALLKSAVSEDLSVLPIADASRDEPLSIRLRRMRKERGLTLADLASQLGVSKPTVWAWEQGRSLPTVDRHEGIAEVLGMTVSDLRTGRDGDAAAAVIDRSRQQIAEAYGVGVEKIRIMIEL